MPGLSDLPRSGVWRLNAQSDTPLALVDLACQAPVTKHNLLAALATALQLPADFGMNWDAAWDCLNDPHWMVQRAFSLRLAETMPVDADALSTFLDLFNDACDAWRDQGQHLLLAVITRREDLPCIQALASYPAS